jgi:hypothetical protein
MKCFTHQLSFAAAVAMAVLYTFGALIAALFPTQALQLWAPLFYLRTAELLSPFFGITFSGFFSGLIQSFMYTYVYTWLLGTLYNFLTPCNHD